MSTDWVIRTMQPGDLAFAAACTQAEGWVSEDFTTLQGFHSSTHLAACWQRWMAPRRASASPRTMARAVSSAS